MLMGFSNCVVEISVQLVNVSQKSESRSARTVAVIEERVVERIERISRSSVGTRVNDGAALVRADRRGGCAAC